MKDYRKLMDYFGYVYPSIHEEGKILQKMKKKSKIKLGNFQTDRENIKGDFKRISRYFK